MATFVTLRSPLQCYAAVMLLHPRTLPTAAALLCAVAPALAASPIQEHTCPDGLTVLVAEDHALPLITVEIAAKNGSMTESPEYNGLSHLCERPVCSTASSTLLAHASSAACQRRVSSSPATSIPSPCREVRAESARVCVGVSTLARATCC